MIEAALRETHGQMVREDQRARDGGLMSQKDVA
jgi:hypothetical protein